MNKTLFLFSPTPPISSSKSCFGSFVSNTISFQQNPGTMAWRQLISTFNKRSVFYPNPYSGVCNFSSESSPYMWKVGISEFLNGIGKGVETHVEKLETELGDLETLLVTRGIKFKKIGIPCKHRKLIMRYTNKYRLGLWRPQRVWPKKA